MTHRQILDPYDGPWTPGIDVSAYQSDVDWPLVARSELLLGRKDSRARERTSLGCPIYAIVRAADGVQTRRNSKPDPLAVRHLTGAAEAGLEVDVYIYVRAWYEAAPQVAVVLEVLRVAGVRVRTIWLDVEGARDNPRTEADESKGIFWHPGVDAPERPTVARALAVLLEMRRLFEAEGYRVGIYAGALWQTFANLGADVSGFADLDLWTAWYTLAARYRLPQRNGKPWPWRTARIWQKGGGGAGIDATIAGIRGPVDANLFRGDAEACRAWLREPDKRRPRGCALPR